MGPMRGKYRVIASKISKPRFRDVMTIGMLARHSACIYLAYARLVCNASFYGCSLLIVMLVHFNNALSSLCWMKLCLHGVARSQQGWMEHTHSKAGMSDLSQMLYSTMLSLHTTPEAQSGIQQTTLAECMLLN